ncbi:SagB/ThcOx family dehydrogenase [Nonomuraea sp. KC401]|uniref:SagB/ThcOx family dehydrogenase n=1 Tax=Nonomuraea longispora TaxID=1848320 RepID=A0A4R4NLL0_9ACTN|nr:MULTISPECIES: SagB family peptide dehydrogenase [Nonomuraea]NBE91765.1 SagB/ThcOx family dehydrogenase [Nonomuraea sp. K271]TDC10069.1 SagB/ThcOx family dehydrogenase [Nonomuraea longispora]TLF86369.1 SagB/ThcOx family dehydrogenase [Nonomuraea sp. KC401]
MAAGFGDKRRDLHALWSFREDVHLEAAPHGKTLVLHSRWDEIEVPHPGPAVFDALRRMSLGPIHLDNVISDEADLATLHRLLDRLDPLVVRSLGVDREQPMVSVVPLVQRSRLRVIPVAADVPVRLSRFAVINTNGRDYRLESPLALHRVLLHTAEAMSLVGHLRRPTRPDAVRDAPPYFSTLVAYLAAAGMVVGAERDEPFRPVEFAEDTDDALISWSPVNLLFHSRSTLGRHDLAFGATHPVGDRRGIEPVVVPPGDTGLIRLYRPTWEALVAVDPPLSAAVEAANGARPAAGPLTARELGELLYRAARVRSVSGPPGSPEETSDRPYLSVGSRYELELYVVVGDCNGISQGVYRYDPLSHGLRALPSETRAVVAALENARLVAQMPDLPPALVVITARFRRLSWKYNGLSYAMILKNVGMLTQTLCLVAAGLSLGVYPLECVDIERWADALGADWRIESSVGALVLGRKPHPGDDAAVTGWHEVNDAHWADLAHRLMPDDETT